MWAPWFLFSINYTFAKRERERKAEDATLKSRGCDTKSRVPYAYALSRSLCVARLRARALMMSSRMMSSLMSSLTISLMSSLHGLRLARSAPAPARPLGRRSAPWRMTAAPRAGGVMHGRHAWVAWRREGLPQLARGVMLVQERRQHAGAQRALVRVRVRARVRARGRGRARARARVRVRLTISA